MAALVFVYGSLKRGFRHHRQMGEARFVRAAALSDHALFRVGAYPAAVPCSGARVRGEVYRVSEAELRRLDAFEDCPNLYQRVAAPLDHGQRVWVYTMTATAVRDAERLADECWSE